MSPSTNVTKDGLLVAICCVIASLSPPGCAEERAPIDRVQANVIRKEALVGEWYYLQTVVDSPYSAAFTIVGEQSYAEKIEWEIQEEFLVARRTYEWIAGSEPEGINGPSTERGAAVAMYAIENHFDIRRDYNPTTGEELNIVVENDTDRHWYEREYMRVDWSVNHITDADVLSFARLFDGVEARPVAYYVQEPDHPDAPVFDFDETSGELQYMDIVNKVFMEPTMVWDEWWGEFPSCWLWENLHLDCVGAEVTIRNSFMRVDESRDYQPWDYSGDRMSRFGYFVVERAGHDPHYGIVDPARYRFINRHNMWVQSHRRTEEGELISCTSDGECIDTPGSVCDIDLARARRTEEGACTVPYRDREIRHIVYYLSMNFPEEFIPDMEHVQADWNIAFQELVDSLRENECNATGGGGCGAERDREDAEEVFVFCHNPVTEEDHGACGSPGTVARIGDLRYSILGWVSDAHSWPPLGYGPAAIDPETGEILQASVFVYGPALERLAAYGRDLLALLNGDLSQEDIASGINVQQITERLGRTGAGGSAARSDHAIHLGGGDAERINDAMDFSWARGPRDAQPQPRRRPSGLREAREWRRNARRAIDHRGGYGRGDGGEAGHAMLDRLMGTPIEAMLTTPDMLIAAGLDPRTPLDEDALNAASPFRGGGLGRARLLHSARRRLNADRCWLRADFADNGLIGLARAVQRAVGEGDGTMEWFGSSYTIASDEGQIDYEAVREMLRHPVFESTMSHELGHTLGLRHNFMGSYDALNYHREYWELRDDGDMQPRAWDPISERELDDRVREYQTSSVMDYGNNFIVTDAVGIGRYDIAAIKMGYGDLVEVFTDARDPHEVAWIHASQLWEEPVTIRENFYTEDAELTAYTYTELPGVVGGIDALDRRADVPYSDLGPDPSLEAEGVSDPLIDSQGRPAVPYRFCSDEVVDLDPTCMMYDAGADPFETVQSIIDTYWYYYVFNNFRQERIGFEVDPYYWRILERYMLKVQWANQSYALYRADYEEMYGEWADEADFYTRPDGMGAWTLAAGSIFQLLTQVIATPEPGGYSEYTLGDGSSGYLLEWWDDPEMEVDAFEGRFQETTWDFDQGYYWFDALERVGFFYDKVIALQVLVDPVANLVGEDEASDLRSYALSFYNTFRYPLTGFLGGVVSTDWAGIGPRFGTDDELLYPDPDQIYYRDMPGTPIDPHADYTIGLFTAAFAMALLPQHYTQEFINEARIYVRGGAEGVDIEPAYVVEFYYDWTGMTYVAASYPECADDECLETFESGFGARMLNHAQALSDAGEEGELAWFMDSIDIVRSLTWEYGFGSYY